MKTKPGLSAKQISIHASHAGGDNGFGVSLHSYIISIHASHAGGDTKPMI